MIGLHTEYGCDTRIGWYYVPKRKLLFPKFEINKFLNFDMQNITQKYNPMNDIGYWSPKTQTEDEDLWPFAKTATRNGFDELDVYPIALFKPEEWEEKEVSWPWLAEASRRDAFNPVGEPELPAAGTEDEFKYRPYESYAVKLLNTYTAEFGCRDKRRGYWPLTEIYARRGFKLLCPRGMHMVAYLDASGFLPYWNYRLRMTLRRQITKERCAWPAQETEEAVPVKTNKCIDNYVPEPKRRKLEEGSSSSTGALSARLRERLGPRRHGARDEDIIDVEHFMRGDFISITDSVTKHTVKVRDSETLTLNEVQGDRVYTACAASSFRDFELQFVGYHMPLLTSASQEIV